MNWEIRPLDQFVHLRDDWRRLNQQAHDSPVLDPDFIEPLLKHFGDGQQRVAVCRSRDQITALAIVHSAGRGSWQTFQPSQAPIGLWVSDPILPLAALLPPLLRQSSPWGLVFAITQQDPDIVPRPAPEGSLRTLDYIQTARITVDGTFDDYWARRGKNLRHNMKRQRNRLAKEHIATRLEVLTEPSDMLAAVRDYGTLESAGWKANEGTAIRVDNSQGRFYAEMLERYANRQSARVYRYWFNDQLAAVDLCIEQNGILVILKTTYDERIKESSPALLMRQDAFAGLFAEGRVRRIEFYGKVMDWHTKWSDEIRTMYHVNWYRWSWLAGLLNRGA